MSARPWRPAYIGVGSNLDSPERQVASGIEAIAALADTILVSRSSLYRSAPLGPADQPDFVNAVVGVLTRLAARDLLAGLQQIERDHGRSRDGERWGPRTLDLDLLAVAGQIADTDELTLPHPGIAERNFVLLPWQEITPRYRLPNGSEIARLASGVSHAEPRIERIG